MVEHQLWLCSGKAQQVEEVDPFIKDTEDLVRSMQTSSPSWDATDASSVSSRQESAPYASYADGPQMSDNGNTDSSYRQAGSDSNSAGSATQRERTDSIEMVSFDKGTSREELKDANIIRRNGTSQ